MAVVKGQGGGLDNPVEALEALFARDDFDAEVLSAVDREDYATVLHWAALMGHGPC